MNKNATLMSHLQNAAIAVLTVTAVLLLIQTPLVGDLAGKTPYELAQDWLAGDTSTDTAVTTDLICGFPDETNREFEQTMAFIEKCAFADMHIFPYSVRPGTKAAELVQFSAAVKEERTRRAVAVARTMHRAYLEGCVGQTYPVLYEQEKDGLYTGHAPNYCEVCVRAEDLHNRIIDTKIVGIDGDVLIGELT